MLFPMTYNTLAYLQRLGRHIAPNFGKSAKNSEMGGLWGVVSPKVAWNAASNSLFLCGIVLCICGCNSAKNKMQDFAQSVARIGYPKNFDPTPIATPLTDSCNLWHFYSGGHSQCAHQIWSKSDHPKGVKNPPKVIPLK